MKKTGIITKREYLYRVNKKSFIFITLFAPVLFAALVFVPLWLASVKSNDVYEIVVADRTGKYASLFKDTDRIRFAGTGNQASAGEWKNSRSGMFAFLDITGDLLENPRAATLYSEKQIPPDLKREISHMLNQ
jgi:ABC-2 type transport system permease protein